MNPVSPEMLQIALAIVASYAAFGDKLVKLLQDWRKERIRPSNAASLYFRDLADALTKINAELREKRVPRIDGTRLNVLLQSFEKKTGASKSKDIPPTLADLLRIAANAAKTLDAWALDRINLDEAHKSQLLASIERAAGTCSALATLRKEEA
jgi:hypothetical protein